MYSVLYKGGQSTKKEYSIYCAGSQAVCQETVCHHVKFYLAGGEKARTCGKDCMVPINCNWAKMSRNSLQYGVVQAGVGIFICPA